MATVGSSTAAATNRMTTIFFETLHLSKDHASSHLRQCPKDNPTVLNTPFNKFIVNSNRNIGEEGTPLFFSSTRSTTECLGMIWAISRSTLGLHCLFEASLANARLKNQLQNSSIGRLLNLIDPPDCRFFECSR